MKTATCVAFAIVILAGCTASGNSTTALDVSSNEASPLVPATSVGATVPAPAVDEEAPKVMAAGTSPISPDIQTAFCQDQVGYMYSAEPQFVTAREPVVAADGSTTIDVTIDNGAEGIETYICRLDAENRFVGVIAPGAGLL